MDWQNELQSLTHTSNDTLPELMLTHLSEWGAITMTGDDKKSYLQGQVTCDVVTLAKEQSTLGAHCDAKGKVWSAFRLFHHNDGYALLQPKSAIEVELAEIKKYAIFSKIEIIETTNLVLGVMGVNADDYIHTLSQETGDVRPIEGGSAVKIEDNRWALLVNEDAATSLTQGFSGQKVSETLWQYFDILSALPKVTKANQNEHIPQALNLQALDGISFKKGCYTGQETVARAKYRGINKRQMFIVSGNTEQPLDGKSIIELERGVGENWRSAGQLLDCYQFSNGQAIGLIVLPNNLGDDVPLRLTEQPNTTWSIQPLPYSLDEE